MGVDELSSTDTRAKSELKSEQMISFLVGGEEFAIDIQNVREVISCPEITRLPRAPAFVRGVIDLRGEIIPVVDMRARLGMRAQERTSYTAVIIVETEEKCVGAVVDRICQVIRMSEDQITPPVPLIAGLSGNYIRGMGRLEDRLIVILDVSKLLTDRELTQLAELEKSRPDTARR